MISIENLSKRYGTGQLVLKNISVEVKQGEFFTLLGPSGCGKTTLLRCIAGLENAAAGRIAIGGTPVLDMQKKLLVPPEGRNIGMVFQSYAIWPHMTVAENVAFPARVRKLPNPINKAHEALRVVDLGHLADRSATQLSGGQQQRVALARAIVANPDVLLLDEPLSNLDAGLREQMRGELRKLQTEIGITTVLVTHDQTEALSMSDRIAIIDNGVIKEIESPEKLYLEPKSSFTASFLGESIPIPFKLSEKSDFVEIETPLGSFKYRTSEKINDNTAIYLRPEKLLISRKMEADAAMAKVLSRRFIGTGHEYDIEICAEPPLKVQIRVSDDPLYEPGENVFVSAREAAFIVAASQ